MNDGPIPNDQRYEIRHERNTPVPEQYQAAYALARQLEPQATPHRLLDLVRAILKDFT